MVVDVLTNPPKTCLCLAMSVWQTPKPWRREFRDGPNAPFNKRPVCGVPKDGKFSVLMLWCQSERLPIPSHGPFKRCDLELIVTISCQSQNWEENNVALSGFRSRRGAHRALTSTTTWPPKIMVWQLCSCPPVSWAHYIVQSRNCWQFSLISSDFRLLLQFPVCGGCRKPFVAPCALMHVNVIAKTLLTRSHR